MDQIVRISIRRGDSERTIEYDGSRPLAIGRTPKADLVLDDERASREHCEVRPPEAEGGPFILVDLKSRNGTRLNGQPVKRAVLKPGDVIGVGSTRITFGASPAGESVLVPFLEPPGEAEPRRPRPHLVAAGAALAVVALVGLAGAVVEFGRWLFRGPEVAVRAPEPQPVVAPAAAPAAVPPPVPASAPPSPRGESEALVASAPAPGPTPPAAPVEEEELWRALHLEHSGAALLEAYQDFVERYPAAARAQDARAVLGALEDLRAGEGERLLLSLLESARELCASGRFAEAGALLSAGERIAERAGARETAAKLAEERTVADGLADEALAREQAGQSDPVAAGRPGEAFRALVGRAPALGGLPRFQRALLEFERAFAAHEPAHRPALAPDAAAHAARAQAAFSAARYREARAEYLLALAADPAMGAEDRAALLRKAGEAALVARMFEEAVALLASRKPELSGIAPYPARVTGASAEAVEYDLLLGGAPPVPFRRRWEEVRDPVKLKLFASVGLGGEGMLGLAHLAWEIGDDAAAEEALIRLLGRGDRWRSEVQAVWAQRRETPVPEGGYVVHEGRLVDPRERARLEEEKRRARERAEEAQKELAAARREGRIERFLILARSLREEGHFEAAQAIYLALAKRFPEVEAGREAARRAEDPVLRACRISSGDPPWRRRNRITFYFLGEGYPVADEAQAAFETAARRAYGLLLKDEPYREYAAYLDGEAVNLGSRDRGVDRTPGDVKRDTPLGGRVEWDSFSADSALVEAILARAAGEGPRLAVVIGNDSAAIATGGGGVACIPKTSLAALPHEVGHALAGLHDEYDSPSGNDPQRKLVKGRAGNVPARARPPNLAEGSARAEVLKAVPWRHWIEAGEAAWWNRSRVEVFEGGGLSPVEVWRPQSNCLMRFGGMFCVVCMEAMVKAIYRQVRPIDEVHPAEREVEHAAGAPLVLEAEVLKPRTHFLEARWRAEHEPPAPPPRPVTPGTAGSAGPTTAVAAPAPAVPPARRVQGEGYRRLAPGGRVVEGLRVPGEELRAPGSYRFTLEVRDPTPWVLRDEEGLLSQSRSWTVRVRPPSRP